MSRRELSDAALRFDLAPGVRRRHVLKIACESGLAPPSRVPAPARKGYGPHSYGLRSHGLYSYGLYSYGL